MVHYLWMIFLHWVYTAPAPVTSPTSHLTAYRTPLPAHARLCTFCTARPSGLELVDYHHLTTRSPRFCTSPPSHFTHCTPSLVLNFRFWMFLSHLGSLPGFWVLHSCTTSSRTVTAHSGPLRSRDAPITFVFCLLPLLILRTTSGYCMHAWMHLRFTVTDD